MHGCARCHRAVPHGTSTSYLLLLRAAHRLLCCLKHILYTVSRLTASEITSRCTMPLVRNAGRALLASWSPAAAATTTFQQTYFGQSDRVFGKISVNEERGVQATG